MGQATQGRQRVRIRATQFPQVRTEVPLSRMSKRKRRQRKGQNPQGQFALQHKYNQKNADAFEHMANQAMGLERLDRLNKNLHRLKAARYESWMLAQSIVRQFHRTGQLSERQWACVPELLEQATGIDHLPQTAPARPQPHQEQQAFFGPPKGPPPDANRPIHVQTNPAYAALPAEERLF